MRAVVVIALNTFREIIRDRILYGIVVFALLLIAVSLALGELSFTEQARISANFGLTGIQMSASVLAIFAGSTLVAREIDKQTVLTLLARPVSRTQFLLGKFLGLSLVVLTVMAGLALVLIGLLLYLDLRIDESFAVALYGIVLEALLLTAAAIFFGTFARPMMTVVFTVSLFLIGHWVGSLGFFIEKSKSQGFKSVAGFIKTIIPDLETFNWRSAPLYGLELSAAELLKATAYGLGWLLVLLAAASLVFRRRDFV